MSFTSDSLWRHPQHIGHQQHHDHQPTETWTLPGNHTWQPPIAIFHARIPQDRHQYEELNGLSSADELYYSRELGEVDSIRNWSGEEEAFRSLFNIRLTW